MALWRRKEATASPVARAVDAPANRELERGIEAEHARASVDVVEPEPVEPAKASEPEPRPPTVLELLGRKPHPLLAWGIRAEQPAWPAKREPEPRVSYGGNLLRASEVADAQRVVDAAAEWQRLRDERPWTREIAGPFGVRDRDWWV
jgi:hypothetical protein